jgi:hypothetical protein
MVDALHIQPKKLLQDVEVLYRSCTLKKFVRESPWLQGSKRKAKLNFCNDAFEIAWILNKAHYLLNQVEITMKDWTCVDQEQLVRE